MAARCEPPRQGATHLCKLGHHGGGPRRCPLGGEAGPANPIEGVLRQARIDNDEVWFDRRAHGRRPLVHPAHVGGQVLVGKLAQLRPAFAVDHDNAPFLG